MPAYQLFTSTPVDLATWSALAAQDDLRAAAAPNGAGVVITDASGKRCCAISEPRPPKATQDFRELRDRFPGPWLECFVVSPGKADPITDEEAAAEIDAKTDEEIDEETDEETAADAACWALLERVADATQGWVCDAYEWYPQSPSRAHLMAEIAKLPPGPAKARKVAGVALACGVGVALIGGMTFVGVARGEEGRLDGLIGWVAAGGAVLVAVLYFVYAALADRADAQLRAVLDGLGDPSGTRSFSNKVRTNRVRGGISFIVGLTGVALLVWAYVITQLSPYSAPQPKETWAGSAAFAGLAMLLLCWRVRPKSKPKD